MIKTIEEKIIKTIEEKIEALDKICEFNLDQLNEIIQITRERKKYIIEEQVFELRDSIIKTMTEAANDGLNTTDIPVGQYREDTIKKILKEFNIRGKCTAEWIQKSGYCGPGRWQINITWRI